MIQKRNSQYASWMRYKRAKFQEFREISREGLENSAKMEIADVKNDVFTTLDKYVQFKIIPADVGRLKNLTFKVQNQD